MRNGNYELIIPPEDYPGKRYRGRYAYEHRVNWWRKTGQNPDDMPNSVVHHKDERRRNNAGTNLERQTRSEHTRQHMLKQRRKHGLPRMNKFVCEYCSVAFERRIGKRYRFCSRECIGLFNFPARYSGQTEQGAWGRLLSGD